MGIHTTKLIFLQCPISPTRSFSHHWLLYSADNTLAATDKDDRPQVAIYYSGLVQQYLKHDGNISLAVSRRVILSE